MAFGVAYKLALALSLICEILSLITEVLESAMVGTIEIMPG